MVRARLLEWWWRGSALRAARERLVASEAWADARRRARVALGLGERAEEPSEPFERGPDRALACELYREAAHWAWVALSRAEPGAPPSPEQWPVAADALLLQAAGDAGGWERLRGWLGRPSFVDFVRSAGEQAQMARELRAFASVLVTAASADETELHRLRAQRRRRLSVSLLLLAFGIFRALLWLQNGIDLRTDLARGKPWRASSEALHCDPEARRCGNYFGMTIFFHTQLERSPWLEIDLGEPQQISSVRVRNRTDCCSDLALPLVVELSTDQRSWREVARRENNFRTWAPAFSPSEARWVRLRIDRNSALHLERVSVYR